MYYKGNYVMFKTKKQINIIKIKSSVIELFLRSLTSLQFQVSVEIRVLKFS